MDRHAIRSLLDEIAASGDTWFTLVSLGDGERYRIRDSAAGEAQLTLGFAWVSVETTAPAGDDAQPVLESAAASPSLVRAWVESGAPPRLVIEGRIYNDGFSLQALFLTVRDVLRVVNASGGAVAAPVESAAPGEIATPSAAEGANLAEITAAPVEEPEGITEAPPPSAAWSPSLLPSVTDTLPPVIAPVTSEAEAEPELAAEPAPAEAWPPPTEPALRAQDTLNLEPPEAVPPAIPPSTPSEPYAYRPVVTTPYTPTSEPAVEPQPPAPVAAEASAPAPEPPPVGKTVLIARRPPEELEPPAETPPAPQSTVVITRSVTTPPAPISQRSSAPAQPPEPEPEQPRTSSTSETLPPTHVRGETSAVPPTVVAGRDVWARPGQPAEPAQPAASETPRCPRCSAAVLPTDRFCMSCGRPLMHGAPPPVGQPAVAPVTEATTACARCGASNPAHFRFCQSCGSVLGVGATVPIGASPAAEHGVTCPHCSYLNPADNRFCQGCGRPLVS